MRMCALQRRVQAGTGGKEEINQHGGNPASRCQGRVVEPVLKEALNCIL